MEETLKRILDTKDHSILEEVCKKPAAIVHAVLDESELMLSFEVKFQLMRQLRSYTI